MLKTSQRFLDEMNEPFKNKWLGKVIIGATSHDLQLYGKLTTDETLHPLSAPLSDLLEMKDYVPIALFQKDYTPANGESVFYSPKNYSGVVFPKTLEKGTSVKIKYTIDKTYINRTVDELIFDFDSNYPRTVTISYDVYTFPSYRTETKTFTNEGYRFKIREEFEDISFLEITFSDFANDNMLIIKDMMFGEILVYDNDDLSDGNAITYDEAIFYKSDELPYKKANIIINNQDQRFDVENPNNEIELLEKGQDIYIMFGYEFADGTQEFIKTQKLLVDSWSVNEQTLNISCIDRLNYLGDSIEIDWVNDGTSTHRESINKSLTEGYEDYFNLSNYSYTIPANNPIIYNGYRKQGLLMSALTYLEYLKIDENDIISSKNAYLDLYLSEGTNASISNGKSLRDYYNTDTKYWRNYATFEKNYVKADGSFITPIEVNQEFTGFIGKYLTNENNVFEQENQIDMYFNYKVPYYISCFFVKGFAPTSYRYEVYGYNNLLLDNPTLVYSSDTIENTNNETLVIDLNISNNYNNHVVYMVRFIPLGMDKPHVTVHLKYVILDKLEGYKINPNQYSEYYPQVTLDTGIKYLIMNLTGYNQGTERTKVFEKQISFSLYERSEIVELDNPVSFNSKNEEVGFNESGSLVQDDGNVIVEHIPGKSKHIKLTWKDTSTTYPDYTITLYGKPYSSYSSEDGQPIGKIGETYEITNNMLPPTPTTTNMMLPYGLYYREDLKNKKYSFDYMGNPALEVGDLIYIETKQEHDVLIRIEKASLTFNAGGLRGNIEGRKI